MPDVVAPDIGVDEAFFWEGIERGELLFQACASCGEFRHPPRPVCPKCHSLDFVARRSNGRGRVLSWMIPRHPAPEPGEERLVILVELDEGIRMVSNLHDVELDGARNGMRVEVRFVRFGDVTLPQFVPVEDV